MTLALRRVSLEGLAGVVLPARRARTPAGQPPGRRRYGGDAGSVSGGFT